MRLTQHELDLGVDFLARSGQSRNGTRQEFVLLSDALGLSMLVDALGNDSIGATASTGLGPFHNPRGLFTCDGDGRFTFGGSCLPRIRSRTMAQWANS